MTRPVSTVPVAGAPHLPRRAVLRAGARAGLAGGIAMAAWLMFCGEVANEPTSAPGVDSSTWTALTGIAAFWFGQDAFHGDFAALAILGGAVIHLLAAAILAIPGTAIIVYAFAGAPEPLGGALAGFAYGIALEILAMNVAVNAIQADSAVYESIPQWGWWVGHAAYGTTLGLVLSRRLSGRAERAP